MKKFYKNWFSDLNSRTRPKFKTLPNLTARKMKGFLEEYVALKMPGLL